MSATDAAHGPGVVVAGDGATLRFGDDSRVLDFETGGFGHGAARVERAVRAQMRVNPLATRHFLSSPLAALTTRLAGACPGGLEVSYLCNSRAEAVEGALKLARGFHRGRSRFVAVAGGYHGSTLGALSVCGVKALREPFSGFALEVDLAPASDGAEDLVGLDTAAAIIEPWPGGIGGASPPAGWLRRLARRCAETGTLLIADETRSGIGRTGTMFAVEHEDVVPDILVLGDALGGGVLPVAGYVAARSVNDRVYGRRDPTLHASATGGNPAACMAALATIEAIERDGLLNHVAATGDLLLSGLRRLALEWPDAIDGVYGLGLFARIGFRRAREAITVAETALREGLAVGHGGGFGQPAEIELCPPILVNRDEIRAGLGIFRDAIATSSARPVGAS